MIFDHFQNLNPNWLIVLTIPNCSLDYHFYRNGASYFIQNFFWMYQDYAYFNGPDISTFYVHNGNNFGVTLNLLFPTSKLFES